MRERKGASGFTLIEGMIAVGVVATLGAVALPAYKDYTVRSRVEELIRAAATCKTQVAEFYMLNARFPASAKEAGCPENVTANANPLAVFNGEVIVQAVGGLASQLGSKNIFAFRAICRDETCAGAPIQAWSCSSSGAVASSTTILPKYLPSPCR